MPAVSQKLCEISVVIHIFSQEKSAYVASNQKTDYFFTVSKPFTDAIHPQQLTPFIWININHYHQSHYPPLIITAANSTSRLTMAATQRLL